MIAKSPAVVLFGPSMESQETVSPAAFAITAAAAVAVTVDVIAVVVVVAVVVLVVGVIVSVVAVGCLWIDMAHWGCFGVADLSLEISLPPHQRLHIHHDDAVVLVLLSTSTTSTSRLYPPPPTTAPRCHDDAVVLVLLITSLNFQFPLSIRPPPPPPPPTTTQHTPGCHDDARRHREGGAAVHPRARGGVERQTVVRQAQKVGRLGARHEL